MRQISAELELQCCENLRIISPIYILNQNILDQKKKKKMFANKLHPHSTYSRDLKMRLMILIIKNLNENYDIPNKLPKRYSHHNNIYIF